MKKKLKKYEIKLNIETKEEGDYGISETTLNGGSYFSLDTEKEVNEYLLPKNLNEVIRSSYAYENPFEEKYEYPIIKIDNCGVKSIYRIPRCEEWRFKETPQIYKTGEIIAVNEYYHKDDKDVDKRVIVRFKRHNKYYVTYLQADEDGFGGFDATWLDEDEIIKLEGDLIKEMVFDRGELINEPENPYDSKYDRDKKWDLSALKSIKEIDKRCKTSKDNDKCNEGTCGCIISTYLTTFGDEQIIIFGDDAELISEVTGIKIERKGQQMLEGFENRKVNKPILPPKEVKVNKSTGTLTDWC